MLLAFVLLGSTGCPEKTDDTVVGMQPEEGAYAPCAVDDDCEEPFYCRATRDDGYCTVDCWGGDPAVCPHLDREVELELDCVPYPGPAEGGGQSCFIECSDGGTCPEGMRCHVFDYVDPFGGSVYATYRECR
jgi:hypothetical protein